MPSAAEGGGWLKNLRVGVNKFVVYFACYFAPSEQMSETTPGQGQWQIDKYKFLVSWNGIGNKNCYKMRCCNPVLYVYIKYCSVLVCKFSNLNA